MPARKSQPKKAVPAKDAAVLEKYRAKRNFSKTPEPAAAVAKRGGMSFVIQEHHARSHHFDFRLEMDGVLASWAVPKGVPEEESDKRLAVHVEDHPLEYGSFEGVIPKGNYGAGTVSIWDKGHWEPVEKDWRKSYGKGKIKFQLDGKKAHGTYLLARMGEEPNWLLRKIADAASSSMKPEAGTPGFISPQLARVAPSVPTGEEWLHEIKYDGYRLIAVKSAGETRLYTRNQIDWTERFQGLADALSRLSKEDFVLDGEAVVLDKKGRSRFGDLQEALRDGHQEGIRMVVFDLLHFGGMDLRKLSLTERLERLAEIVPEDGKVIRRSRTWRGREGKDLFSQACKNGLEGIISKKASGHYAEGQRRDWVKCKCRARQEFVICGYTPPKGSLNDFGALVLASYENGRLIPRGKVGTGFSAKERERLRKRFDGIHATNATLPTKDPGTVWLQPLLVAEIEFAEITRDGSIRQGSFVGLREDKEAADVHLDALPKTPMSQKGATAAGIVISHPERLVFPADLVSKLEVASYYETVGGQMMPFVANRPLAILRAPDGLDGPMFFQKSFPNAVPPHVHQTDLADGNKVIFIRNLEGLVSLAQYGVIEFHPWGTMLPKVEKPDLLIWDLDPDASVAWNEVLGAALFLRDFLEERGLQTIVKTSGGKGLHIVMKIRRNWDWAVARNFTKAVAQAVMEHNPRRFTITASKTKRKGRIFIDWMRNGEGATCVAPWSLRARPGATVSMPIAWSALRDTTPDQFTIRTPSPIPDEWLEIPPQTIPRKLMREFNII